MSKGIRQNGVFLDAGLLRNHVSKLREEKRTASQLRANVAAMKNCCDPAETAIYKPILRDIEQLIEYLDSMANVLSLAGDDAVQMSHMLGGLINDDSEQVGHTMSENFML